jgi:hypothetical protein
MSAVKLCMKITVIWDVALCIVEGRYGCFGGTSCLIALYPEIFYDILPPSCLLHVTHLLPIDLFALIIFSEH